MSRQSWLLTAALVLGGLSQWVCAADAAPAARVFEIRTYYAFPGRLDALHKRFREHTMKMFEKHGMTNVAYWTPQDSPAKDNTLIYVVSHTSREAGKEELGRVRRRPGVAEDLGRLAEGRQDRRKDRVGVHGRNRLLAAQVAAMAPDAQNGTLPIAEKGPDLKQVRPLFLANGELSR